MYNFPILMILLAVFLVLIDFIAVSLQALSGGRAPTQI